MNVQLESPTVEMARVEHLPAVKRLADKHKLELGFINLGMLRKAIEAESLLIAMLAIDDIGAELTATEAGLVGFVHFYVRRDSVVTLYSIVVAQEYRQRGLGCRLFAELVRVACSRGKTEIRLKCPIELSANAFYEHLGLEVTCVEEGKHRPLNVWTYTIHSQPVTH
jgi:ribosomal protein S18 acetylase RimI-like enzyme